MNETELTEWLHELGIEHFKYTENGNDGAIGFVAEFSIEDNIEITKMSVIRGLLDTADLIHSIIDKAQNLQKGGQPGKHNKRECNRNSTIFNERVNVWRRNQLQQS